MSGVNISSLGILNAAMIDIGYEFYAVDIFSLAAVLNIWACSNLVAGSSLLAILHPVNNKFIDLYCGIGIESLRIVESNVAIIDFPAVLGLKIKPNDSLALGIQAKPYLMSLDYGMADYSMSIAFMF